MAARKGGLSFLPTAKMALRSLFVTLPEVKVVSFG
jgi:hypothetical protein